eukprot:m.452123 g.452123  ORF g.452123 m.452123 type:complete len:57 (-) comp21533_c0_seq22:13-183(-)
MQIIDDLRYFTGHVFQDICNRHTHSHPTPNQILVAVHLDENIGDMVSSAGSLKRGL